MEIYYFEVETTDEEKFDTLPFQPNDDYTLEDWISEEEKQTFVETTECINDREGVVISMRKRHKIIKRTLRTF